MAISSKPTYLDLTLRQTCEGARSARRKDSGCCLASLLD